MRLGRLFVVVVLGFGVIGCSPGTDDGVDETTIASADTSTADDRQYLLERVDDAAVVQLYADGFEALDIREKTLIWHLYQAALAGRDIFYDQRYAHNLEMREVLEEIVTHADDVDPQTLSEILRYTKLFWINTGPFNNLTARKFVMNVTPEEFASAAQAAAAVGAVRRESRPAADAPRTDVLRSKCRCRRDEQVPGCWRGHPAGQCEQPLRWGVDARP